MPHPLAAVQSTFDVKPGCGCVCVCVCESVDFRQREQRAKNKTDKREYLTYSGPKSVDRKYNFCPACFLSDLLGELGLIRLICVFGSYRRHVNAWVGDVTQRVCMIFAVSRGTLSRWWQGFHLYSRLFLFFWNQINQRILFAVHYTSALFNLEFQGCEATGHLCLVRQSMTYFHRATATANGNEWGLCCVILPGPLITGWIIWPSDHPPTKAMTTTLSQFRL